MEDQQKTHNRENHSSCLLISMNCLQYILKIIFPSTSCVLFRLAPGCSCASLLPSLSGYAPVYFTNRQGCRIQISKEQLAPTKYDNESLEGRYQVSRDLVDGMQFTASYSTAMFRIYSPIHTDTHTDPHV